MPELKNVTLNPEYQLRTGGLLHTITGIRITHLITAFGQPDMSDSESISYTFELNGELFAVYQRDTDEKHIWKIGGKKETDFNVLLSSLEDIKLSLNEIQLSSDDSLLRMLKESQYETSTSKEKVDAVKNEIVNRWEEDQTYYQER